MIVTCEDCKVVYDDAQRWTLCPHSPLWAGPHSYCRTHDLVNCKLCAIEKAEADAPRRPWWRFW